MLVDVTQNLHIRIVPVNNPREKNKYDEQMGYYNAYVAVNEHELDVAQSEWMRGIVHSGAGCGSHSTARIAVLNALDNWSDKFGLICVADTKEVV